MIISIPETAGPLGPFGGLVITNPECLTDCFAAYYTGRQRNGGVGKKGGKKGGKKRQKGGKHGRQIFDPFNRFETDYNCLALLIDDVTSKGTCDNGFNPAAMLDIWGGSELPNSYTLEEIESEYYYDYGSGDYDYYDYDYYDYD